MTDVFDQNTTPPNNVAPPDLNDPFADKLKAIVNERGEPKYKDTQSALDALKASQDHIKRLEDEAKARQSEIANAVAEKARADALEEIVQRFSNNSQPPSKVETPTKEVDETAIVKTLEALLEKRDAKTVAQSNVQAVTSALVAKFGDEAKTKEAVAQKAAELGMTPQRLGALSSENPKAVLAWFGVDAKVPSAQPVTPSQTPLNPPKPDEGIKMPEFSLISGKGATDKNRAEVMKQIKEKIYRERGLDLP